MAGIMPSTQWKMKNYHQKWYAGRDARRAIGQGAVAGDAAQLARIIGGIASGGHLVRPHVVFAGSVAGGLPKARAGEFPGSGDVNIPHRP